ncbi:MAG: integration host factor subunit alpha [Proteobacteria bacterium]|nr:integration host factor subunit alpha [Pseudomonadota bacterium]MBU4582812.1 integration host factor subunit alpha [Pseudomonadota bacterium]
MALTKNEMVQQVQDKTGLTRKESMAGIDGLFKIIKDELSHGKPVKISGFGKWTVLKKKARKGRNPQTGKEMTISARKVVTFKPSNVLRNAVND